jgi:hypothetical protein
MEHIGKGKFSVVFSFNLLVKGQNAL